jgi:deoxycytidylate deaminase
MSTSSKNKTTGIRIAEKEAKKSSFKQHRMGAVIVKSGNIISTGYNSKQPSKLLGTPTRHAEASAILKILKQRNQTSLAGAELYVTRFTPSGTISMARPCLACMDLIRAVGIKRIHYSNSSGSVSTELV